MMRARLSSYYRNGIFIKLSLCAFRSQLAFLCSMAQSSRILNLFLPEQIQSSIFEQNFDPYFGSLWYTLLIGGSRNRWSEEG